MTTVNPYIFRAYDIRGIAEATDQFPDVDLSPESIKLIGRGIGTYIKRKYNGKNIVVGRDNRTHGEVLQNAFIEGLLETGCDVTNIGLATSPLLYWAVCKYEFDGGINITASHNPKEYNGIKVVGEHAHSICGDELQEVLKLIDSNDFEQGEGSLSTKEVWEDYKEHVLGLAQLHKPLKVVIDAGNGTAGKFAPDLLRAFGCEVTEMYCELDGTFPNHEANPEDEENLVDMIAKVKEIGADLGIGFDGDGDRVGIVDENGKHYSADYLLMLLARDLLGRHPGASIVFDVKVSQAVIDDIKKHGGEPVMSKTGHSFIETKIQEIGALLGGEVSGHMFFAENYYGFDDAFLAALKILEVLSLSDVGFSHLFDDVTKLNTTPEFKAHTPDDKKFEIVDKLRDHFTKHYDCITIDGVRINFTPHSWGAIRCSNTSPNLTLRFEADSPEQLREIIEIMVEQLKNYPEVSLDWYEKWKNGNNN